MEKKQLTDTQPTMERIMLWDHKKRQEYMQVNNYGNKPKVRAS